MMPIGGRLSYNKYFFIRAKILYKTKKNGAAPIVSFRVGGSFSQNPETTFLLSPGGMHVEHHAASAPRCRGAGDQRCAEMIS